MDEAPAAPSGRPQTHGFTLALNGGVLELAASEPLAGAARPTLSDALAAIADYPVERAAPAVIAEALRVAPGTVTVVGRVEFPDEPGDWKLLVSANKMTVSLVPRCALHAPHGSASSVPVPEVTAPHVRAGLAELGVVHGIRQDVLGRLGAGAPVEAIVAVAEGTRPVATTNALIEYTFDGAAHAAPVQREDGSVDHHAATMQYSLEAGSVLARRIPPREGVPGIDVFANAVPVPAAADQPLAAIAGAGTEVEGDLLRAAHAGRPVRANGKVEVLASLEIKGDVNYAVGNIKFSGDVIIGGDVKPGFRVEADGSVTVRGVIDRATVSVGRDLTAGGIVGDAHVVINAGGDLKAQYIHNALVSANGTLTANREIVDCVVSARKVVTPSSGRIVGGEVTAREEVVTGSVGSGHNLPTHITVLPFRGGKQPAVVRVSGVTHAGTAIKVGHTTLRVVDALSASSFWEVDGEITRLGPAAAYTPPVKPGAYMAQGGAGTPAPASSRVPRSRTA